MKITTFIMVCSLMYGAMATAQSAKELAYDAYLSGSMSLWKKAVAIAKKKKTNPENNYAVALAQYGLLSSTMATKDEDTFDEYEPSTTELLENLEDHPTLGGDAKALLSSILGLKMAYSPWKGMFLGPKSSRLIEQAAKLSPQSSLVWKLYGQSKLFTPVAFGGNRQKAVDFLSKSITLYEQQGDTTSNWLYLDAHAFLGMAYQEIDRPKLALKTYQKALDIEPNYRWVKYSLLPEAEKSLNNE